MRIRNLIIGLAAYLFFLPFTLPAGHLLGWLGGKQPGFALQQTGGTAWAGHVEKLNVGGLELDKVRWKLRPVMLLLGRLEFRVTCYDRGGHGETHAGRSLMGNFYLRDARMELAAAELAPLLPLESLRLAGTFRLDLKKAVYKQGPVGAEGSLVWSDAALVEPVALALGSLRAELQPGTEGVQGTLTDMDGPLHIAGEFSFAPDATYAVSGTVEPRASLPAEVRRMLPFLGQPDAQGRYPITLSGTL